MIFLMVAADIYSLQVVIFTLHALPLLLCHAIIVCMVSSYHILDHPLIFEACAIVTINAVVMYKK